MYNIYNVLRERKSQKVIGYAQIAKTFMINIVVKLTINKIKLNLKFVMNNNNLRIIYVKKMIISLKVLNNLDFVIKMILFKIMEIFLILIIAIIDKSKILFSKKNMI